MGEEVIGEPYFIMNDKFLILMGSGRSQHSISGIPYLKNDIVVLLKTPNHQLHRLQISHVSTSHDNLACPSIVVNEGFRPGLVAQCSFGKVALHNLIESNL